MTLGLIKGSHAVYDDYRSSQVTAECLETSVAVFPKVKHPKCFPERVSECDFPFH